MNIMSSREKLIEAIKEIYSGELPEPVNFTNEGLKEFLYDTVDTDYLDHGEQRIIAQVGERFFRYHRSDAEGIDLGSLEEVEPYDKIETRYRLK
jgi:hypothetical protein